MTDAGPAPIEDDGEKHFAFTLHLNVEVTDPAGLRAAYVYIPPYMEETDVEPTILPIRQAVQMELLKRLTQMDRFSEAMDANQPFDMWAVLKITESSFDPPPEDVSQMTP